MTLIKKADGLFWSLIFIINLGNWCERYKIEFNSRMGFNHEHENCVWYSHLGIYIVLMKKSFEIDFEEIFLSPLAEKKNKCWHNLRHNVLNK